MTIIKEPWTDFTGEPTDIVSGFNVLYLHHGYQDNAICILV